MTVRPSIRGVRRTAARDFTTLLIAVRRAERSAPRNLAKERS